MDFIRLWSLNVIKHGTGTLTSTVFKDCLTLHLIYAAVGFKGG
jgi:hypothetical protein